MFAYNALKSLCLICTKCLLQPSVKAQFPGIMDFFLINPQKSVPHGQFQLFFFFKWHLGSEDQKLAKDK